MPKTSYAVAQACAKVEIQPGCVGSWLDIGGEATTVAFTEETVATGSLAVFNNDTHIKTSGKKPPITVSVSGAFSSVPTEAYVIVKNMHQTPGCSKLMCLRVTPEGGNIGDQEIYLGDHNDPAILSGFTPPSVDAGTGATAGGRDRRAGWCGRRHLCARGRAGPAWRDARTPALRHRTV